MCIENPQHMCRHLGWDATLLAVHFAMADHMVSHTHREERHAGILSAACMHLN
jgi:hypothetical protein